MLTIWGDIKIPPIKKISIAIVVTIASQTIVQQSFESKIKEKKDMISKNNTQICIIISNETNQKLEALAQKECRSKSQLVNYIIKNHLDNYEGQKAIIIDDLKKTTPEHLIDFLNPDYYKK